VKKCGDRYKGHSLFLSQVRYKYANSFDRSVGAVLVRWRWLGILAMASLEHGMKVRRCCLIFTPTKTIDCKGLTNNEHNGARRNETPRTPLVIVCAAGILKW
jgi:hypothetical protein